MLNELKTIGTFLVTELTTDLVRKQKKASGGLVKSFESKVNSYSGGYEVAVWAATYFKFVEYGVNGTQRNRGSQFSYKNKKPPMQAILEWVKIKSIASGDREARSAAFAIQNYIYKNGVQGINILEEMLKRTSDQYLDKIADSTITKMSVKIDNIISNGNIVK